MQDPQPKPHPLWPFIVACGAAALLIDLGSFHQLHHADTLVPILVSLQHWTPFYWSASRFGMLLPLLALPFHNPFTNLLVQCWLGIFAGLAGPFLMARYMVQRAWWPVVGTLAAGAFLLLLSKFLQFEWMIGQQYGLGLALAFAGMNAAEHAPRSGRGWPTWVALAFLVLANWINFLVVAPLLPLVLLRYVLAAPRPPLRPLGRMLLLLVGSALIGRLGIWALQLRPDVVGSGLAPIRTWPATWALFGRSTWSYLVTRPVEAAWLFVPPLLGLVAVLAVPRLRPERQTLRATVVPLVGAAVTYWFVVALSNWVKMNDYAGRYALPSVAFLVVAGCTLVALPLMAALTSRLTFELPRWLSPVLATAILVVCAVIGYGTPSAAQARADVDRAFGSRSAEILANHTNVVAGNYWNVWPAVFHANLMLYDRKEQGAVYGLAHRSRPTQKYWQNIPVEQLRLVAIPGDPEIALSLRPAGLCLDKVEHRPPLEVLKVRSCPAP